MRSRSVTALFIILLIFCAGYYYYKHPKQDDIKLDTGIQKDTVIEESQKNDVKALTKADVKAIVRDEINNDPEIVVKAIETHIRNQQQKEDKRINQLIQANKDAIMNNSNDPVYGKPTARSTIVNYYDYNCSHCKKMSHVIKRLIKENQDVYIIFKELPILGQLSTKASTAALAVNKISPSKYLDFHFALIEDNTAGSMDQKIKKVAQSLGINTEQLYKEMDNAAIKSMLESNVKLASNIGIRGIPAFIINGQLYPAMSYEQIIAAIAQSDKTHDTSSSQGGVNPIVKKEKKLSSDDVGIKKDENTGNDEIGKQK